MKTTIRRFHVPTSILALALSSCGTAPMHAALQHGGTIQCFQETDRPEGKPACELSAAVRAGDTVVFANDKPIHGNGKSPVFSLPISQNNGFFNSDYTLDKKSITYFNEPAFKNAVKYESLTITHDGKWVIAATGFDRYQPGQEGYNTILAWPVDDWRAVKAAIFPGQDPSATDSVPLREKFKQALGGVEYFKIEGLAAIPAGDATAQGKLLFGVRETGPDYKRPEYAIKIIQAGYHIGEDKRLHLHDDFKQVADYTDKLKASRPDGSNRRLGLSSIEYDQDNKRLYLLTSYEEGAAEDPLPGDIGAYLWALPLSDLGKAGALPQPILGDPANCPQPKADGKAAEPCPLEFKAHKAEGLAVLDKTRVLVVFDDDRVKTQVQPEDGQQQERKPGSESGYQILELH